MASATEQPVTLLLLGRTGNGKSSTGNSILHKKVFKTSGSNDSTKYEISKDSSNIHGKEVIVVDGPSVRDAEPGKQEEETNALLKAMEETFSTYCSKRISALLIVLKYGIRYTRQEKEAVMTIKSVFGSDVLKKFGVIVMTHGDSFEMDMEDEDFMNTFEDWCNEQGGDVKALFEECEHRVVILNNRSKDGGALEDQFKTLMTKIEDIQGDYTEREYQEAETGRKELIVLSKLPKLKKETERIVDKITSSLNKISEAGEYGSSDALKTLTELKQELGKHEEHLKAEDNGTEIAKQPIGDVKLMKMRLDTISKLLQLQTQELSSIEEQEELRKEVNEIQEQENKDSVSRIWPFVSGLLSYLYSYFPSIEWLYPTSWKNAARAEEYTKLAKTQVETEANLPDHKDNTNEDVEMTSMDFVKVGENKGDSGLPTGPGPST